MKDLSSNNSCINPRQCYTCINPAVTVVGGKRSPMDPRVRCRLFTFEGMFKPHTYKVVATPLLVQGIADGVTGKIVPTYVTYVVLEVPSGNVTADVSATVLQYRSANNSENAWDFSTDGAPASSAHPFPGHAVQSGVMAVGPLMCQVVTTVGAAHNVVVTHQVHAGDASAEVLVSSGPLDVSDGFSKDVILRLDTDIASGDTWYTDSNGLEFQRRTRNARPWQTPVFDPKNVVSSNYCPITLGAVITESPSVGASHHVHDTPRTMALLTTTSQGASSTAPGSLEVMVNRAVLKGDVVDPTSCTNSTGNHRVTVRHVLLLRGGWGDATGDIRPLASELANPVVVFAGDGTVAAAATGQTNRANVAALPPQAELVTAQLLPPDRNVSVVLGRAGGDGATPVPPPSQGVMLVRLRHIYAVGEGATGSGLSEPVVVDLGELFAPRLNVTGVTEVVLTGAQTTADSQRQRLVWHSATSASDGDVTAVGTPSPDVASIAPQGTLKATLAPMEVRAFEIDVA